MVDARPFQTDGDVRRATDLDYAAFTGLFPDLAVDDPTPSLQVWQTRIAPFTFVAAAADGSVVGYCFCEELDDTGYVRNVVVASSARRRGVGRALMMATAEHLRRSGKRYWRLNVKPNNHAALALYARMGLRPAYTSVALRLPWGALTTLPHDPAIGVRHVQPEQDVALETQFDLPRGQLAKARQYGRLLFEAVAPSRDEIAAGLAVFDPGFPGAFPFRVVALEAADALLHAIRTHAPPTHAWVALVVENDDRLRRLLVGAGSEARDEILHLVGAL